MLKEFNRVDKLFSLCGLNCSLCPSFVRGNCLGCQNGSHCALTCPFAPCSVEHGGVTYCFECDEYPCRHYDGVDEKDSLISHKNQLKDIEKAKRIGIEKYHEEQLEKIDILNEFLEKYDNGHRDVFFCLAVNMMDIDDLKIILNKACELTGNNKSDIVKQMLIDSASKKDIVLKLRKGDW
jgi:hypothetical protein